MTRPIAHFFWHGSPLSIYERACIASFVKAEFDVRIWSFDSVAAPPGTQACDAAKILPRADLTRYTQAGIQGNIAAFTDFFRYELLAREGGWWFDTDVLCLKPGADFGLFEQPLVVGREDDRAINGAVLRISEPDVARRLKSQADVVAERAGYAFHWGAVGPELVTKLLAAEPERFVPLDRGRFYPVHWREALLLLDPDRAVEAKRRVQGAHALHLWNEVLRRYAVPKSLLPPQGSYLDTAFREAEPSLASLPCLPADTFRALVAAVHPPELGFMDHVRALLPAAHRALRKHRGPLTGKAR